MLMSAIIISYGLLIVLFTILLLYRMCNLTADRRPIRITKNVPILRLDLHLD
jgi:hypothetical protein